MKYLLDTMVWLRSVGPTEKIGKAGLEILTNGREDLYFSAAGSWEVAIKTKLGKFLLVEPPGKYVPKRLAEPGVRLLPITQEHALGVYDLPLRHYDLFDRLIIDQAMAEDMVVLTADRALGKYAVEVVWCGR